MITKFCFHSVDDLLFALIYTFNKVAKVVVQLLEESRGIFFTSLIL